MPAEPCESTTSACSLISFEKGVNPQRTPLGETPYRHTDTVVCSLVHANAYDSITRVASDIMPVLQSSRMANEPEKDSGGHPIFETPTEPFGHRGDKLPEQWPKPILSHATAMRRAGDGWSP